MAKVWSKRFDNSLNPFIEKFNASISFDKKLILEDLDCSIAHAKMLGKTQVLSPSEASQIINALELIKVEYLQGKFFPSPPSEDIHYCIEEKLISLIGETGKKLHTGRSRNDQVGTDIRLWLSLNSWIYTYAKSTTIIFGTSFISLHRNVSKRSRKI